MNKKIPMYAIITVIVVAILIVIIGFRDHLIGATVPAPVSQAEINSTGTCSNQSAGSPNESIITCHTGERFGGFKLLKVNGLSVQILIYDDCAACMHDSTNGNQFIEVMNVSLGQHFGSSCEGIYPSELLSVNTINESATFGSNMSKEMICA